jgi:nuclear transport factor 2 (NTF2) superfamily protein
MQDTNEMIERWVASWHEPDPDRRRATIDELWAADCAYRNVRAEFIGRDGIQDAVTAAHETWVEPGYAFRVARIDVNHDAVRYTWEMVRSDGEEPASVGTHFALLDAAGRLVNDHQFIDKAPPA